MTIHTYKGKKIEKLMKEIEENISSDYKIIKQTESVRNPFLFWLKKYEIEVEVIEDHSETTQQINQLNKQAYIKQASQKSNKSPNTKRLLEMLEEPSIPAKAEIRLPEKFEEIEVIRQAIEQTTEEIIENSSPVIETTGYLQQEEELLLLRFYEQLVESEIREDIAKNVMEEVKESLEKENWLSEEKVEAQLLEIMTKMLTVTGELPLDEIKVIALIGPTGVGKTTTVAKIAGYMADKKKKVGLITTDVYRIGATEQLQIYANILDSEMIAINSPEELGAAIEKLTHEYKVDQIIIDTVGRNPLDIDAIDDVKEYLTIANPDHISLVLSSTQKTKDVRKILKNFTSVSVDSLIFTKLDETINHGVMLNAVVDGETKIAYITNGQNVPYDIYQAESLALAKKILNGVDDFGSSIFSS